MQELNSTEPDRPQLSDLFGVHIAQDSELRVIGSQGDDTLGPNTGFASVYQRQRSTWVFVAKLLSSDAEPRDRFGHSVGLGPDEIYVRSIGRAYAFSRSRIGEADVLQEDTMFDITGAPRLDGSL